MGSEERSLRVMQSFRPSPTTNPYLLQLARCLEDYVTVDSFSWRTALLGRYDVFHLHWPEVLVVGRTTPRSFVRSLLFLGVLIVARVRDRAIVRTVHNVAPHDPFDIARRMLFGLCDRWTTVWITLTTAVTPPQPRVLIPHGHYRDWYQAPASVRPIAGRALFFGYIRKYKGVDDLISIAPRVETDPFSLRIVGHPRDEDLAAEIEALAEHDGRVSARLEFVNDWELAGEIRASCLVVLPYRSMVNSGAALLALSLGRPILVPASPSTEELQREVGDRWVMTYEARLSEDSLATALHRASGLVDEDLPDLSARDWDRVATEHLKVYRAALSAMSS